MHFGVHAGLQNTSIAELQALWRRIEDHGFDWISIWDHFYAADNTGNPHCLEAITTHTALAVDAPSACGAGASCTPRATGTRRCSPTRWRRSTRSRTGGSSLGLGGGWLQQRVRRRTGCPSARPATGCACSTRTSSASAAC